MGSRKETLLRLPLIIIGIVPIAFGLVSLAYQDITYTSRETVLNVGPIKATADTQKTIPLPPILGGLTLAGGIVLLAGAWRSRSSYAYPRATSGGGGGPGSPCAAGRRTRPLRTRSLMPSSAT